MVVQASARRVVLYFFFYYSSQTEGKVVGVDDTQTVTPWDVEGADDGIDYEKRARDFGSSYIDQALIDRIERVTGRV
jgi:carbon starvation protein CstA